MQSFYSYSTVGRLLLRKQSLTHHPSLGGYAALFYSPLLSSPTLQSDDIDRLDESD